jgi:hypothetical protein
MAKARRGSKRNVGKAALVLGAAGVSLAVTGGRISNRTDNERTVAGQRTANFSGRGGNL